MATTYDKASLVLIPSGTKEGTIFSQKPTNGDGDFTFSRSTSATRVGPSGYIEKETQNLFTYSNTFSDSSWLKADTSVTGGQAGYDGTNDAWLLDITGSTGFQTIRKQPISYSGVNTFSFYAKAGTLSWLRVNFGLGSTYFDIGNGVVGATDASIGASIEAAGNGYYRCIVPVSGSSTTFYIYPASGNGNVSQSSGNLYIQDAQWEQGLVARDYIETTTSAVYGGITDNIPRLDYTDSSCPSLLLEPQRTNLVENSEYFSGFTLSLNTLTSNAAISPDGTQNASLIESTTTASSFIANQSASITIGNTYTFSVFAKKGNNDWIRLAHISSAATAAWFDLENGVVGTVNSTSATIEDYGNGWYRCTNTFVATHNSGNLTFIGICDSDNSTNAGAIGQNDYIWGWQLEEASYATSYIPTYGSAVTRNNDVCASITTAGDNGLINDYQTSIFIDLAEVISDSGVIRFVTLTALGGANNPRVLLYANANQILVQYRVSGQSDVQIASSYIRANQNKALLRLNDTSLAFFHNGVKVSELTIVKGDDIENLLLAEGSSLDSGYRVNKLLSFPTALTDEEAIALTTI